MAVENHIVKALDSSHTIQWTLDILVDSIAEAQKGSLLPRVVSPALIMETLRSSIPSFPLGKDYLFLMYQLSKVSVYTYRKRLGYVISVPLVQKRTFTMLRMIPIPVPVDEEHFFLHGCARFSAVSRPNQAVLFHHDGRRVS